jgi:hypothetical protein
MKFLCSFEHWDRGFDSHSRHGCLPAFLVYLCFSVEVAALRQSCNPVQGVLPTVCKIHSSRLIVVGNRPEGLTRKVVVAKEEEEFTDTRMMAWGGFVDKQTEDVKNNVRNTCSLQWRTVMKKALQPLSDRGWHKERKSAAVSSWSTQSKRRDSLLLSGTMDYKLR